MQQISFSSGLSPAAGPERKLGVRHRSWCDATCAAGFTLLEMVVVMVLLGLLTTLVLPAMQRWHDGVQARAQVAAIVEALHAAAFAAPASRKKLIMDTRSFSPAAPPAAVASGASGVRSTSEPEPSDLPAVDIQRQVLSLPLPTGWSTESVSPAAFLPNGLCVPGYAALRTERAASIRIDVRGPVCSITSGNTAPQ